MEDLRFTGERVVPGDMGNYMDVLTEHLTRYTFAVSLMRGGERVLDAASGTGYGSFLLAMAASSVVGLDIAHEAVRFASDHFSWPGLSFEVGNLDEVVLPAPIDMVVSFETLEHLEDPSGFVARVADALQDDGLFLCSVPRNQPSEFHKHVYEWNDARELIEPSFDEVHWFAQRNHATEAGMLHGWVVDDDDVPTASYFLAVCRGPRRETGR